MRTADRPTPSRSASRRRPPCPHGPRCRHHAPGRAARRARAYSRARPDWSTCARGPRGFGWPASASAARAPHRRSRVRTAPRRTARPGARKLLVHRPVEHDHAAVGREQVGLERRSYACSSRAGDRDPARVGVLDGRGRQLELARDERAPREVVQVVEGELAPVQLLDAREQVPPRAALGVVGRLLVRVLAVGELEASFVKPGRSATRNASGRRTSSRSRPRSRPSARMSRRQAPPRLQQQVAAVRAARPGPGRSARAEPARRARSSSPRARSIAGPPMSIISTASRSPRTPRDHVLERVEVDADEVEGLDPVLVRAAFSSG